MDDDSAIHARFARLTPCLTERTRRLFTAAEAAALGRGGIPRVSRATGVSRRAITAGLAELLTPQATSTPRVRRPGGGRQPTVQTDRTLRDDLERLSDPVTRGAPESPLRWTCKSVRKLAEERRRLGHPPRHRLVAPLLHDLGSSLQANRKTLEGTSHPDRDAPFAYIHATVQAAVQAGEPVIAVEAKKRELVGDFTNAGREWHPAGPAVPVRVYDCVIPALGRGTPDGVYDMARHAGWVNVGTEHHTAACAVARIRRWWQSMGQSAYPQARTWLITADGGGSKGSRVRLWQLALQRLADETGVESAVSHCPPGTSKWNKSAHRLFSFISQNWRGKPLVSHEVIVNLIAATTTTTGLTVVCPREQNTSPAGVKVSPKAMEDLHLQRDTFHGEWNYTILPSQQQ